MKYTMEKQYKVLWADDLISDWEDLCRPSFEKYGIEIITAVDGNEVREKLNSDKTIHGVIADAHFPNDKNRTFKDKDISGLSRTVDLLRDTYTRIPMVLLTANFDIYTEQAENSCDFSPCLTEKDVFQKLVSGDIERCCKRLIEKIEEYNTPEFVIYNKYKEVLDIANTLRYKDEELGRDTNAKQDILKWLILDYNGELNSSRSYFNPMRKIAEQVRQGLASKGIIPSCLSLNNTYRFFGKDSRHWFTQNTYERGNNVDHSFLVTDNAHSLAEEAFLKEFEFFLDMTNDASHDNKDLKYHVTEYVSRPGNPQHIFRATLYALLDILIWYGEISKKYTNEDVTPGYFWQEDPEGSNLTVYEDANGNWYNQNLLIKPARIDYYEKPSQISVINSNLQKQCGYPLSMSGPIKGVIYRMPENNKTPKFPKCLTDNVTGKAGELLKICRIRQGSNDSGWLVAFDKLYSGDTVGVAVDNDDNWYCHNILIKSHNVRALSHIDTPITIDSVMYNEDPQTKNTYKFVVTNSVLPGYILEVKKNKNGDLYSNSFLIEDSDVDEGDMVYVTKVVKNTHNESTKKNFSNIIEVQRFEENTDEQL